MFCDVVKVVTFPIICAKVMQYMFRVNSELAISETTSFLAALRLIYFL